MTSPNLIDKLTLGIEIAERHALSVLIEVADGQGVGLYLVGGTVRDLLLEASALDLDVTVVGDGLSLAAEAAALLGASSHPHPAFQTATLLGPGFAIDIATARSEDYPRPGALPSVRPAPLHEDLFRRDFTINAIALGLNGPDAGLLIDPYGGMADLDARLLRILHDRSFQDDATRILRAFRYELRLRLRIEDETAEALRRDVAFLETISGARIHHEIARIMDGPEPEKTLLHLDSANALAAIHPAFNFGASHARAFARLREIGPEATPAAYWPLLGLDLDEGEAEALAGRTALNKRQSQALCAMPRLRKLEPRIDGPELRPSDVFVSLAPFAIEAVWALAAAASGENTRRRCLTYLRAWSGIKPELHGDDLLKLGVPPGARVGEVLQRLKIAKLDGEVQSRDEEERLVRSLIGTDQQQEVQET